MSQLEKGEHVVENAYRRAVRDEGNPAAKAMLADVFETTDRSWRGIGMIPQSGWRLSERYREYDAEYRFQVRDIDTAGVDRVPQRRGAAGPDQAARVRRVRHACTPRNPLGATMVSSEGACAAYYLYRRLQTPAEAVSTGG